MAQPKTLNEQQIAVLRWIAGGCTPEETPGEFARISAGALRNRGLVVTTGRGPTWTARITDAGTKYLASLEGPNPPIPRQPNGPVTEQLVHDVIAAGGTLRVPRHTGWDRCGIDYERRARNAQQRGRVPSGSWLQVINVSSTEMEIRLVTPPESAVRPIRHVEVPEVVGKFDPLVREFRDLTARREVSKAQMPRMLRILHALIGEAGRRGHQVALVANRKEYDGSTEWSGVKDGHLTVKIGAHTEVVRVTEEGLPNAHYWERRNYYDKTINRARTSPPSETDAKATGRLQLELLGHAGSIRPSKWTDRQDRPLEDALGELLWEIEVRAYQVEQRVLAERREAEQRKIAWEEAKVAALARYNEHRRAEVLADQVARWRKASEIRAYCEEVQRTHPDDPTTTEWIEWALGYADAINPPATAHFGPRAVTTATADKLAPFMDGWDAHTPTRRR
ncbi:MAG: hypothetical protein F2681_15015 [Actinobacteria bacterium]|uniref:Unannotated protein n=2 Tax=freshwater metagenome TaxID=449393 RepID=A0A6J6T6J4_9ZZZZ|nr:hypothetical protein [Actinomycetota bacterium]MSW78876.1 hypothetical protein [Actinomycetota bacterium]MSZ84444.1 hypothetical protein [Actinomycetota bacterium]MTB19442.1 hypothetical protein [Actinomycetota bacterium]